jgi:hypothetical protein
MANPNVEGLEKARRSLIGRRGQLIAGIPRLPDGDLDRVVRHAEYVTALQVAIEAIDRAILAEEKTGRRPVDRRQGDRRQGSAGEAPAEGDRRAGQQRQGERRDKKAGVTRPS